MQTFERGDVVELRGTVKFVHPDSVSIDVDGTTVYCDLQAVRLVRPKLEVGQRVYSADNNEVGTIVAMKGEKAWVEFPTAIFAEGGHDEFCDLDDLSRPKDLGLTDDGEAIEPDRPPPHFEVGTMEVAEGTVVRNPDGTYTSRIGEFKPAEGPDPLKAVLESLNAEPNVNKGFCDGITNGPSFDKGGF